MPSYASPLALVAHHSLVCPTHTPQLFQSNAAVISLLETLTALLVARGGEQARGRIENFHDRRFAAGVYDEEVSRIREPHG